MSLGGAGVDFAARFAAGERRRFAVIGRPIGHSLSPQIHQDFARQRQLELDYGRLECDDADFARTVHDFIAAGGAGLNITTPFKVAAHDLCSRLSPSAAQAGAVNTIRAWPDGSIEGHITDGLGLARDLAINRAVDLVSSRILILGAGATARAVVPALLDHKPGAIFVFNRGQERLDAFLGYASQAAKISAARAPLSLADDDGKTFDLIINCASTALGDHAAVLPELPSQGKGALAYDLSYGQGMTAFRRWAEALGCASCDGVGMLAEQAAFSFVWWHGEPMPVTGPVIAKLAARPSD